MTLVVLPGADGLASNRAAFVRACAGHLACVIIEPPRDILPDYRALCTWYQRYLPDGPLCLLGESFSGPAAIHLAASNPERVRHLVLCSSFARPPIPGPLIRFGAGIDPRMVPNWLLRAVVGGGPNTEAIIPGVLASLVTLPGGVLAARLRSLAGLDRAADLHKVTVPVLWVHGSMDRLVPLWMVRKQAALDPAGRLVRLQGGHFLLQENPAGVVDAICSDLRRSNSGGD